MFSLVKRTVLYINLWPPLTPIQTQPCLSDSTRCKISSYCLLEGNLSLKWCSSKTKGSFTIYAIAPCKRMQHFSPTTPDIVECYMFRPFAHPVACCWELLRKVWKWSNYWANNPTFFLFLDCPKHSAKMLDPFAQLFQHCWGHACSSQGV